MKLHELPHIFHHLIEAKGDDAKWAGVILIVIGLVLTPACIGIPIVIVGIIKIIEGFKG
jgi:hypothetical protein